MRISAVDAGEKGELLMKCWAANGHETDSTTMSALAMQDEPMLADVILLDLHCDLTDPDMSVVKRLDGKLIVDCGNVTAMQDLRRPASLAEHIAQSCPDAAVVKAFNVMTPATLQHALAHAVDEAREGYIAAYYCGDDVEARRTVVGLIEEAHLNPIDCGPLSNATLLEALGLLSRQLEEHALGPHFAITITRRHDDSSPLDRWM